VLYYVYSGQDRAFPTPPLPSLIKWENS
jgi:hypothetical protein